MDADSFFSGGSARPVPGQWGSLTCDIGSRSEALAGRWKLDMIRFSWEGVISATDPETCLLIRETG